MTSLSHLTAEELAEALYERSDDAWTRNRNAMVPYIVTAEIMRECAARLRGKVAGPEVTAEQKKPVLCIVCNEPVREFGGNSSVPRGMVHGPLNGRSCYETWKQGARGRAMSTAATMAQGAEEEGE